MAKAKKRDRAGSAQRNALAMLTVYTDEGAALPDSATLDATSRCPRHWVQRLRCCAVERMFMTLQVAGIVKESIVDGPGIRYAVFVQGCPHHCPGCHNPQSLPFQGGREMDTQDIFAQFQGNPILKGITLSGGEPFCQPEPLAHLARLVHGAGKDVTVFTGYTYEQLLEKQDPEIDALLGETDVLIDGPFLEDQKHLELVFRGSENQRLIDLNATRREGRVMLLEL